MNALNAYRNSFYTTPFHMQLAQLHRRAGFLTQEIARFVDDNDIEQARQCILQIEDIITFLRSSLEPDLEASTKADASYAFYYDIMVRWFLNPSAYKEEFDSVLQFWDSWTQTWENVTLR